MPLGGGGGGGGGADFLSYNDPWCKTNNRYGGLGDTELQIWSHTIVASILDMHVHSALLYAVFYPAIESEIIETN